MPVKTFVPRIVHLLNHACVYVDKHHVKLALYLSPTQLAALDAVCVAIRTFTNLTAAPFEGP